MSAKIRFGLLGYSRVALKVLPAILASEGALLTMIGKRDAAQAKETAALYGNIAYGTYEDVVANKDVDAVYISLPNTIHEEWTIKALRAGKHVICEKPAALSYAAAKHMTETSRTNNVRLMEGLMFRYHPQHAKVMEFIKNDSLGTLMRFDGCFSMPMQNGNMVNKDLGGGTLNYMAPYTICASRMIFGEEPKNVFCKMKFDPEKNIDTRADMIMEYSDGKVAFASTIMGSYFQSTYNVLGSKANIRMSRAYAVPADMGVRIFFEENDKTEEITIAPTDQFRIMLDAFCKEIAKGSDSKEDYEGDLLAQAQILEAARLSAIQKRIVEISEIN